MRLGRKAMDGRVCLEEKATRFFNWNAFDFPTLKVKLVGRVAPMRRILLALVLVLALAAPGWGAGSYYVSLAGSNTAPYNSWATAATDPATVVSYIAGASGRSGTVNIAAGTYSASGTRLNLSQCQPKWHHFSGSRS